MHSLEAILYCSNPSCQAPNPESHRFCQQCRSRLPKRYLWAVGKVLAVRPGELLNDRYWYKQGQIFLDTKPGVLPPTLAEIPESVESYLRLVALQPHVPLAYALVPQPEKRSPDLLLLENAPIYAHSLPEAGVVEGLLMPGLEDVWQQNTGLRQLHWLWQLAHLWEPFSQERVAQTLLTPALLRVEAAWVRLLELQPDRAADPPTLVKLGEGWRRWLPGSNSEIAGFLHRLCDQLVDGKITTVEHLISLLDQAIVRCSQGQLRSTQIATLTDQGPTRQRNEDACFPPSGSLLRFPAAANRVSNTESNNSMANGIDTPLVVVCDGIGGHEGGNIASNLAIATVQQWLQPLLADGDRQGDRLTATPLISQLEQAALAANNVITQRNDAEQRQDRQRMGTTLVMALAQAHELYLTHVGDSRAYRITATGCHQITLDDDLAAREVRLGYAFQRDALQQPGSGSLVQALGMNASTLLHPTVQRFVIDEDCLFLLCSDGLSDHDRVEEYWQTLLLPVLEGKQDLAGAAHHLVTIANQQNGHDNVTIGLIHYQVAPNPAQPLVVVPESLATLPAPVHDEVAPAPTSTLRTQNLTPPTQPQVSSRPRRSSLLLGLLLTIGIGGLLTYLLLNGLNLLNPLQSFSPPRPTSNPVAIPPPPSPTPTPSPPVFARGSRFLINRAAPDGTAATIALLNQPTAPTADTPRFTVPIGSVLEVIAQRQDASNQRWLGVKVCSLPQAASLPQTPAPTPREAIAPTPRIAKPGASGWLQEDAIVPLITVNVSLTKAQLGQCGSQGDRG